MEKQRKWQFLLILAVTALTVYNILPTIFYYLQPLKEPVSPASAERISEKIVKRVADLETETLDWLQAYCDLIHTKPTKIALDPERPNEVVVSFAKLDEARRLRAYLPRAGSLIAFPPEQLALSSEIQDEREVRILRKIPARLEREDFVYLSKNDPKILKDRANQLLTALAGGNDTSIWLNCLDLGNIPPSLAETLAAQIHAIASTFEDHDVLAKRFASRFTQGSLLNKSRAIEHLIQSFDQIRDSIKQEKNRLNKSEDSQRKQLLLERKEQSILSAETYLKNHRAEFASGIDPSPRLKKWESIAIENPVDVSSIHPIFSEFYIDTERDRMVLKLHPDAIAYRNKGKNKERFEQLLVDELARISRQTSEDLQPTLEEVSIPLHRAARASGYLVLDQKKIAERIANTIQTTLKSQWNPQHPDLSALQIFDFNAFQNLPAEEKALAIVVGSPLTADRDALPMLKPQSLYIAVKGLGKIAKNYEEFPNSQLAIDFQSDIRRLAEILQLDGFIGYPGSPFSAGFADDGDLLFEKPYFLSPLLAATRETFDVHGSQKMAYVELGTVEERILTENKIETKIHEDLLKWKDDYRASQVSLDPRIRFDVPPPVKGAFWDNILLSARKYFRGDERKIIRWGLDLSGGKSVQIELQDSNRQPVTNEIDLKQGINELYNRVNKMGVSEVSIRQVGNQIALDFPGSQSLSAAELIKASTLYFHLVNEKFSPSNPALASSVNRFLQEVWNEATVTGKTDAANVNQIAYNHLHMEKGELRSEAAKELWENGLRLSPPLDPNATSAVDDTVSKIAMFRKESFTEWQNQTHPLLIVFRNWALEGGSLQNIHAGYDPSKGNYLSFEVASNAEMGGRKCFPSNDLYAWTSRYSKEKIAGTPLEVETRGRGWRMAGLLNDCIISAPTLDSALKENAMISGSFSQREVNRLASDLKAGSLTFTPHILSEKNVSPELGQSDRIKGVTATVIALLLVIGSMIAYYRFAGLVAAVAVLFNLLILWATLQNLGATLTLAGLAAVVLTIGMAVDANVLVFERIKEEFSESGNIKSALNAGYQKAYSAIIDSNVTTIIAALILLNFDAGPIKSFAVNLIIGIASSMFTALFMTRFYFAGWVQKPKNKALKMANWIGLSRYDFLKQARFAFAVAATIILAGSYLIFSNRNSIFGMDFTGGYTLQLELENRGEGQYSKAVEKALIEAGASSRDFQIRELNPSHHLRILFGTSMELPNKPFHGMAVENDADAKIKNPRIEWIVNALEKANLPLARQALSTLDSSWTAMSGQMSDSMRNNALIGLAISFLCIFVYLAFRFEYKFAAAALLCLFHDVLITMGSIGLLHAFGIEIQIDLNTIAALMTIIGYSLNDTIIIFDRIREEIQTQGSKRLSDIVNHALNATLSRTTITSGTTLLVLIALVLFGGPSIFGFSLVMTIGVFFGTLSSWFIAAPLMIYFHKREESQPKTVQIERLPVK